MVPSPRVSVRIDLPRVRENVRRIRALAPVLPVLKADAYGLGARRIAEAVAKFAEAFCVFSLREAAEAGLRSLGKQVLALGPPDSSDADEYLAHGVHPAVAAVGQASALRRARPLLSVDTGMQRFGCPPESLPVVFAACEFRGVFTHATRPEHARRLVELAGGRGLPLYAAASSLLDHPECYLDGIRPGLAMYRGAVRVAARLVEARDSHGPVGYSGFAAGRHGVILAGYANGVRPGPCVVNGAARRIPEVGMQSSYVQLGPGDRAGDEVVLLGDGVTEQVVAAEWKTTPHEVLLRLAGAGPKHYAE